MDDSTSILNLRREKKEEQNRGRAGCSYTTKMGGAWFPGPDPGPNSRRRCRDSGDALTRRGAERRGVQTCRRAAGSTMQLRVAEASIGLSPSHSE